MPYGDGTGPQGNGPGTGRGMGGCGKENGRSNKNIPLFGGVDFGELKRKANTFPGADDNSYPNEDSSRSVN